MHNKMVGFILMAVTAATLTVVHANPPIESPIALNNATDIALHHPDRLSVGDHVRLHMARTDLPRQTEALLDIKYDASARVSFVAGTDLYDGRVPLLDDWETRYETLKSWGPPIAHGTQSGETFTFYRAGTALVILRITPFPVPSRRAEGTYTYALSDGVGWIPYRWGHAIIAKAIGE